jgi:hypothetical protein
MFKNRTTLFWLIGSLLQATAFLPANYTLPQLFQGVRGASALGSGIQLLPFACCVAWCTVIGKSCAVHHSMWLKLIQLSWSDQLEITNHSTRPMVRLRPIIPWIRIVLRTVSISILTCCTRGYPSHRRLRYRSIATNAYVNPPSCHAIERDGCCY